MNERLEEPGDAIAPEVMFVPLALTPGDAWHGLARACYARRIPDFLHQVLNQGHPGPTAMLELQSAVGDGPVDWVVIDAPPDRDDAFAMMPNGLEVRAIVTGQISASDGNLHVEFCVHRDEDEEEYVTAKVAGLVPLADPVPALLRLARHLAKLLDLRFDEPSPRLLTRNGEAFRLFLQGLDGAMLLSGELEVAVPADREALLQPFADALALDPNFGLALRVANASATVALHGAQVDREIVRRFLDRCYRAQPFDGDACVAIAEQLSDMGDDARAFAWLEHASLLDPPPARGLESLGLLLARRGERGKARGLWQRGLDIDGHPDFCSHLAQLSFAEGNIDDGWEYTQRGLRHLRERTLRAGEWDDAERGAGVLLECLHAQLGRRQAPPIVVTSLLALRSLLVGEERIMLGLCLLASGQRRDARAELVAGLRNVLDLDVRDQGVRALLNLDVADFEMRFARASDRALRGRNPRPAIAEFQLWLHLQPEFWPALYFSALAKTRLRQADEALDLLAVALEIAPGQPDVLFALAEGFDRRVNPKRALELVEEALEARPDESRFVGARVRYLHHLGRREEAGEAVRAAQLAGVDSPELRRLARRLRRGKKN
jgi:tetratricopeptide (TPR) repeat protein